VDSREQGFASLTEGRADAFASDRFLLMNALASTRSPRPLRLIDDDFSVEPYVLALPRDDAGFRLAVNRSLADVFRSGEISGVYERWLGKFGQPSLLLSALYYLQQVPE
jgi:ABC-type amino acid transport substrate-binding protein